MNAKNPSLLSDLGTSLFSQAIVVAGNVVTLRLAAQCMEPAQVGEFALVRRVVAFVAPLLMLGLGVGLPRFLGRSATEPGRRAALALAGWLLVLPTTFAAAALMALRPDTAATLFFGTATAADLARPLALLLVGNQVFLLVFATWRGELWIRAANILQAVVIGLLPIGIMLALGKRGAAATLIGIASGSLLVATCAGMAALRHACRGVRPPGMLAALRTLAGYGIMRVPGDLAIAGLYALGPILTAHALDLRSAGSLAIGLSLVTALSAAFTPIGTALLPRLSGQLSGTAAAQVRARIPLFVGMAVHAALFLGVAGVLFGNDVLDCFMGPRFAFPPLVLELLVAGAAGNVLFVILRSVLDADSAVPLNGIHALVALGALLGVWAVTRQLHDLNPLLGICAAVAASLIALGTMTLAAVMRRFCLEVRLRSSAGGFATVLITLGCGMLLHAWEVSHFLLLGLQLALLATAWIATLHTLRIAWWMEIERTLHARHQRASGPAKLEPVQADALAGVGFRQESRRDAKNSAALEEVVSTSAALPPQASGR